MLRWIIWTVSLLGFLSSAYFLGWLAKAKVIFATFNSDVWVEMPLETQVMMGAMMIVIIIALFYSMIKS